MNNTILERCDIVNANGEDRFVGIKKSGEKIEISFPLGYPSKESFQNNDKTLRNEIMILVTTLDRFSKTKDGQSCLLSYGDNESSFPFRAYLYIIKDYLDNGYYHEREIVYDNNSKGKINWKRTIKQKKPLPSGNDFVYLDFIRKKEVTNYDTYITLIHEFCVYESFSKIGWLYTDFMPMNPNIKNNVKAFSSVIRQQLSITFNDKKKALFNAMLDVVNAAEKQNDSSEFSFGTNRFEYVWENMIDYVFGVNNKDKYFPHAKWKLLDNTEKDNHPLEPDTVIEFKYNGEDRIYIVDAKYYRYGVTKDPTHLPETSSISKQIVYGEYATKYGKPVYNAFVMPFEAKDEEYIKYVGFAESEWKELSDTHKPYEKILGILLDTRYLMNSHYKHDEKEIEKLVNCIEESYLIIAEK